ncbi:hypothetical protein Air01nite_30860 [Asanoa iriomotensis]|uniref:Basic proline-rich protein n=2 Tax=Asanoa iriomotensis TaxID=234613 RepID=A0ABQ4C2I3_9ACTN|nr:hypothetical protein Air01nite_30860 [Asanoa iriomotensis]
MVPHQAGRHDSAAKDPGAASPPVSLHNMDSSVATVPSPAHRDGPGGDVRPTAGAARAVHPASRRPASVVRRRAGRPSPPAACPRTDHAVRPDLCHPAARVAVPCQSHPAEPAVAPRCHPVARVAVPRQSHPPEPAVAPRCHPVARAAVPRPATPPGDHSEVDRPGGPRTRRASSVRPARACRPAIRLGGRHGAAARQTGPRMRPGSSARAVRACRLATRPGDHGGVARPSGPRTGRGSSVRPARACRPAIRLDDRGVADRLTGPRARRDSSVQARLCRPAIRRDARHGGVARQVGPRMRQGSSVRASRVCRLVTRLGAHGGVLRAIGPTRGPGSSLRVVVPLRQVVRRPPGSGPRATSVPKLLAGCPPLLFPARVAGEGRRAAGSRRRRTNSRPTCRSPATRRRCRPPRRVSPARAGAVGAARAGPVVRPLPNHRRAGVTQSPPPVR